MTTATKNPYRISVLDPALWTILGYFYQGGSEDLAKEYAADMRDLDAELEARNIAWADIDVHDNGGCAHCGARFAHGAVAYNATEHKAVSIGHTCASERFGLTVKADLAAKYGAAKAAAERRQRAERFAQLCAEHPGLAEAFEVDHRIISDIRSRAFRFGSVSDKQVALVLKLAAEVPARAAAEAERLAKAEPCPTGKVTITGVVISFKTVHNDFGSSLKMLVQDDRGFRVFGTCPAALDVVPGARVTFSATVTPSNNDTLFGFYKRPTTAAALVA